MEKYIYLFVGILIGWITKVPFLIKWYRELKRTNAYKDAAQKEMIDKWEKENKKLDLVNDNQ